jgi:TM2 domain-containing membrane protein YozV
MLFSGQFDSIKKDRNMILVLSVLFGGLGIDRLMLGDLGIGLLKLFTFGLCGVLWLVDIFMIRGKVDEYNRSKATELLATIKMTS